MRLSTTFTLLAATLVAATSHPRSPADTSPLPPPPPPPPPPAAAEPPSRPNPQDDPRGVPDWEAEVARINDESVRLQRRVYAYYDATVLGFVAWEDEEWPRRAFQEGMADCMSGRGWWGLLERARGRELEYMLAELYYYGSDAVFRGSSDHIDNLEVRHQHTWYWKPMHRNIYYLYKDRLLNPAARAPCIDELCPRLKEARDRMTFFDNSINDIKRVFD